MTVFDIMLSSGTGRPNLGSMSLYRQGNDIRLIKIHNPSNLSAVVLWLQWKVSGNRSTTASSGRSFFATLNSDKHSGSSILSILNLAYFSYENSGFFDEFAFSNNSNSSSDNSPWSWAIKSEYFLHLLNTACCKLRSSFRCKQCPKTFISCHVRGAAGVQLKAKISRLKRRCRSSLPRYSDVRDIKNVSCLSSLLLNIHRATRWI